MGQAVKVALSLPAALLEIAERERLARGESRSEFFRHALETYLRQERQREEIARYVQGYQEQPETDEEIASAEALSVTVLGAERWE